MVDGYHANELVRAAEAHNQGLFSAVVNTDLATVNISAPKKGYVLVNASTLPLPGAGCAPCYMHAHIIDTVANLRAPDNEVSGSSGDQRNLAGTYLFAVNPGVRTFKYRGGSTGNTTFYNTSITAVFIPYDGTGAAPAVASSATPQAIVGSPNGQGNVVRP